MNHKNAVIEAVIKGLIEGGMEPEDAKAFVNLLTLVYQFGYNEAERNAIWNHYPEKNSIS